MVLPALGHRRRVAQVKEERRVVRVGSKCEVRVELGPGRHRRSRLSPVDHRERCGAVCWVGCIGLLRSRRRWDGVDARGVGQGVVVDWLGLVGVGNRETGICIWRGDESSG